MIDFIHVGDFKTGTTWLQQYGFCNHPEIYFLGDYFENREYHRLFHELVDARDLDFDADCLRRRFSEEIAKEPIQGKKVGVSREVLSQTNFITGENARRNAERLRHVFGYTKIIYVIREQLSMLKSIYSQYVKMGGTLNFEDFVFDPIQSKGLINRLQYDKNVAMYQVVFGAENLHVGLFEEFVQERAIFLKKIYDFIGCKEIDYFPETVQKRLNPSLTTVGCFFQRFLNRFVRNPYNPSGNVLPIDKIVLFFLPQYYKSKADINTSRNVTPSYGALDRKARLNFAFNMALTHKIEKISSKISLGGQLRLSDRTQDLLRNEFKRSNRILLEKFRLKVDKYSWYC
jgi:hypothetical protein